MTRRALLLALAGGATAQLRGETLLAPDTIGGIESILTSEMSARRIPGLSIAVGRGKDLLWTNGYGLADVENFVPAKASTRFRTASLAKPVTAVAILQLMERGKLDLDAPIATYIPTLPARPHAITSRQLLGHIAGVRHYRDVTESFNTRHYANTIEALAAFQADDLVHEPGLKMTYTTYGYVLLGAVLESVSKVSYMDYLRENVLQPAGMRSTQVDDVYTIIPNRSRGYSKAPDDTIVNCALHDTSGKVAGGGLISTAGDFVRFIQALDSGKLLKAQTITLMFTSLKTADGRYTGYGLGWGTEEFAGRKRYSHAGGQAGVSTYMSYVPSDHLGISIMCNLEGVGMRPVVDRLMTALLR